MMEVVQSYNAQEFVKLSADIITVHDKVKLCREMLVESPGIDSDEALAEVIGFLEACRDRLTDIIEAGTNGLLGEELFAQCLKTNDAVLRTLDAERTGNKIAIDDDFSPESNTADLLGIETNINEKLPDNKIESQFAAISITSSTTPYKDVEINNNELSYNKINNNEVTSPLMYQTSVASSNEKSKNAFDAIFDEDERK